MILYVTTSVDGVPGSLRAAIDQANENPGELTTIIIQPSVKEEINLTDGELEVSSDVELINKSGHNVTISPREGLGNRLFNVSSPSSLLNIRSVRKSRIILKNGHNESNGGCINITTSPHNLVLHKVIITNNISRGSGGGIYTLGSVTAVRSLIKSNAADIQGGGIWSGQGVTLIKSRVIKNSVELSDQRSGGGGLYIDNGTGILDNSVVNDNKVAYSLNPGRGGSGGGVVVVAGSLYVQNNSHVDNNSAYNSGGIQEGIGNVYLINHSSSNGNQSFNSSKGAAGGGGVTITAGTVYLSESQICNNKTVGMYSGGIVSLTGDVLITNGSQILKNINRGPGGGIAVNIGGVTIDSGSRVCDNTGASLGGGIVSFTPNPGQISVSKKSQVCGNIVTNAQTIAQTIESFFDVIVHHLASESAQALVNQGQGGQKFVSMVPDILNQLKAVSDQLKSLPLDEIGPGNLIAGGGIASLSTSEILIDESQVENNFSGQNVDESNFPFSSFGGGLFGFESKVSLQRSVVKNNISLSSGGGVWSGVNLNVTGSRVSKNKIIESGNGGGLFNNSGGFLTVIDSQVTHNVAKGDGGGIYSTSPITRYRTQIVDNEPNNINPI